LNIRTREESRIHSGGVLMNVLSVLTGCRLFETVPADIAKQIASGKLQ